MSITPYVGGRSAVDGSVEPIKLSSNESALGPSPNAIAAYRDLGTSLHRYPDGGAWALRDALARLHELEPERIICGNGSDEILELLTRCYAGPGDEILYTRHGFLVYPIAALSVGATPVAVEERNFAADVDAILSRVGPKTRIVFLANPNNPTGTYVTADEVTRLWRGLPDSTLLVLDAAYAEYVTAEDYQPGVDLVRGSTNVVMTRTFSKIYGLAALRLGWAYADPSVIDVLNRVRGPFNVNAAALAAGLAAVDDQDHIAKVRSHTNDWRARLSDALRDCGLTVVPSVCNFVLVQFPDKPGKNAKAADEYLTARGIIGRNVDNYHLPDCLRISIGLDHEMEAVIEALQAFTGQG
jgi:histidinol-phosphate aminotransferase